MKVRSSVGNAGSTPVKLSARFQWLEVRTSDEKRKIFDGIEAERMEDGGRREEGEMVFFY
jgi:hypothetical protein